MQLLFLLMHSLETTCNLHCMYYMKRILKYRSCKREMLTVIHAPFTTINFLVYNYFNSCKREMLTEIHVFLLAFPV